MSNSKAPPAAQPSRVIFDPFNSSATGHQRAENRLSGSTSWRESRSLKLREQFASGAGGGKRVSDTVGAGSRDFGRDGRTANGGWEKGAKGLRTGGQKSLWECMSVTKTLPHDQKDEERARKRVKVEENDDKKVPASQVVNPFTPFHRPDGSVRESSWPEHYHAEDAVTLLSESIVTPVIQSTMVTPEDIEREHVDDEESPPTTRAPQIFANLTVYINGSTAPYSDHQIKQMLSRHGGNLSIALGRRTVTHVVLGRPNSDTSRGAGAGGGLAASKIQKEIARIRGGQKVKFVSAEWIVESVRAGRRLPESRFATSMALAPKGVARMSSHFAATNGNGAA